MGPVKSGVSYMGNFKVSPSDPHRKHFLIQRGGAGTTTTTATTTLNEVAHRDAARGRGVDNS